MTIVVGTAGHIDHGKTTLLRALTGIDADRLPEERRRGMTIDVGYAHMTLPDGDIMDFVDVPGHDRLVGNMLVGAGEIDAVLLVIAADDGPRAQTREHVTLLDALGIRHAVVAVTKADIAGHDRTAEICAATADLIATTSLANAPVLAVSGVTGAGLPELREALASLRDRARAAGAGAAGPVRLAIDRVFGVKGRGTVVTGTLRGGPLRAGVTLGVVPSGRPVRVREIQRHGSPVAGGVTGGRVACNLVGVERATLARGAVLAADDAVRGSARLLVALRPAALSGAAWPPRPGTAVRLHLGTCQVDATIRRSRRDVDDLPGSEVTALLRLAAPIAAAAGDRLVLRRPSPAEVVAGGRVVDAAPPTGAAWRRVTSDGVRALASVSDSDRAGAALALHGALPIADAGGQGVSAGPLALAPAVMEVLGEDARAAVEAQPVVPLAELRLALARLLRRFVSVDSVVAARAAGAVLERMVAEGALARTGDLLHLPGSSPTPGADLSAAMDRLATLLDVPAPPALAVASREAGCPAAGIRALEASGRIVRVEDDLAWSRAAFSALEATAIRLATSGPITPATLRDATGSSRKYVVALLEELGRRGVFTRTEAGHVLRQLR